MKQQQQGKTEPEQEKRKKKQTREGLCCGVAGPRFKTHAAGKVPEGTLSVEVLAWDPSRLAGG